MKFGLKKEDKIIKKEIEKKEFIELPETKNEEKVFVKGLRLGRESLRQ